MKPRFLPKPWFLCALFCLFAFDTASWAQLPTATLNGTVTDPQGAVVAGARVAATSEATGISREVLTAAEGFYTITNLVPGTYNVRVEAKGFAPREFKDVLLEVGRIQTLDVALTLGSVGQKVTVTEVTTGVDLTQSTVENVVESSTVQSIPLNGRNFLELAFLLPGNRPAVNFDPTKTNTLEVSSAGQFGRGGNISVDGADNNDEVVGGTLSNFPQDSVQEFQIATNRYTAEVGRSASSIINIITKSGTNNLHGSAFGYFRNRNLQGLPATFDRTQPTPPFDRQQYGGSIGGPLKKDRAWLFASYERRHQNAAEQTGLRDFATDKAITSSGAAPLREHLFDSRADIRITSNDTAFLRYSYNQSTQVTPTVLQAPLPTASNFNDSLNRFHSGVANWTHSISSTQVNTLVYHYDAFLNKIPRFPGTPTTNPAGLAATNEVVFPTVEDGPNYRSPQRTRLDRHQIRDTFAWTIGSHTLHFGGEWQRFGSDIVFDLFGSGSVFLTQDFATQNLRMGTDCSAATPCDDRDIPISFVLKNTAGASALPNAPFDYNNYFGYFIQDDWRVRPNFTLNIGLRWEFDTDIFGTDSNLHKPCPEPLNVAPTSPCVWLRTALDLTHRSPDWNDWGPRIGFAWDPFKKGETVIRGGYGRYYDRVILEAKLLELLVDGRRLGLNGLAGSVCGMPSPPIDPGTGMPIPNGTGAICGVQGTPGNRPQFCSMPGVTGCTDPKTGMPITSTPTLENPTSGAAASVGIGDNVFSNNITHPRVNQFTLGIQQQVARNWLISADGVSNRGSRFLIGRVTRDSNNVEIDPVDPLTGVVSQVQEIASEAKTWFDGLLVSVQRRPVTHGAWTYGFNFNYTLSKSSNEANDDQVPFKVTSQADLRLGVNNLALEKGYSTIDERHRFVSYGLFTVPGKINISPIWTVSSPIPGNPLIAGKRFLGVPRNALAREIHNSNELNAAIAAWDALSPCPLPGPGVTVTLPCRPPMEGIVAPVAPGLHFGSWFDSWDMRVSRTFTFGDRYGFELIGEVFNLFNITNIRGVTASDYFGYANDISAPNFNQRLKTAGGFFGSGGPRAFQFAARFTF